MWRPWERTSKKPPKRHLSSHVRSFEPFYWKQVKSKKPVPADVPALFFVPSLLATVRKVHSSVRPFPVFHQNDSCFEGKKSQKAKR